MGRFSWRTRRAAWSRARPLARTACAAAAHGIRTAIRVRRDEPPAGWRYGLGRALQGAEDWLAAAEALREAVRLRRGRPPAAWVHRLAECSLGSLALGSEAHRFRQRAALRAAREELQRLRSAPHRPADVTERLLARVAAELGDWDAAAASWERASRLSGGLEPSDVAGHGIALAHTGNARAALERAATLAADHPAQRDAVCAEVDRWLSDRLVQDAHAAGGSVRRELLEAAMVLRGKKREQASVTAGAAEVVAAFRESGSAPDLPDGLTPLLEALDRAGRRPVPVFVGGFVYSGSGAVADYLRGSPQVSTALSTDELGVFQGTFGPWVLLRSAPERRADAVADFVSWPLLGVMPPGREPSPYARAPLADVLDGAEAARRLAAIGLSLLAELSPIADASVADIRQALHRLYARVLALDPSARPYLLFSNAIRPYQAELLELVPGARAVAVVRDPRDQFVSQLVERRKPAGAKRFIRSLRGLYAEFQHYLDTSSAPDRMLTVRFEDFLTSSRVREDVLAFLGITAAGDVAACERYDLTASRRNIGIHRLHESARDIERVEWAFPDLYRLPEVGRGYRDRAG